MAIERAGGSSDREVIKVQAIRGVREGGWLTVQSLSFQPLALPAPFFFSFPLSVAIVGERRPKRYSSAEWTGSQQQSVWEVRAGG